MEEAIVRVLVPKREGMADHEFVGPAVIYERERKHVAVQTLQPESLIKLKGDRVAYFRARWTTEGWLLVERVPDQAWPD